MQIRCYNPQCHATVERDFQGFACPACADLLEIVYPRLPHPAVDLKRLWRERRMSNAAADRSGVWRFRELLPPYEPDALLTMQEGNTPVLDAPRAATFAGAAAIRFKHLGWNPTGCFKDLGMTVAVTEAKRRGAEVVACASTGNTAGSMAAYAARAGITARVYLPKGKVSRAKLAQALDYGAEVVEIDGNFDRALETVLQLSDASMYFLNSINPFRIEGQKTCIYELMEQLDWNPPDYIVLPAGNLGNTSAFGKALFEMHDLGLIHRLPRLVAVQASGANAFVQTYRAGGDRLQPVEHPHTRASAICIGVPRSWKKATHAIRRTGGLVLDVSDNDILAAKQVIGRDGIGCEPASAATLAGIRRLVAGGQIAKGASIVAFLTGHVLKDTDPLVPTGSTDRTHASANRADETTVLNRC